MRTRLLFPGALVALLLVAAGCGADSGSGDENGGDAPPAPGPPPSETRLEITVWAEGEAAGGPVEYTLTCDPPGGAHPDPEAACAALGELGAGAFLPVPPDVACTQ
jgi:hypothetical protein